MSVESLSATVTINSIDVSSHVMSIRRDAQLCRVGQTCTIEMRSSFPHASYNPYHPLTIAENGETVLTGYVEKLVVDRAPARVAVYGKDSWKLAEDYYLDGTILTHGETVAYWIDYLCDLTGITYSILPSGAAYASFSTGNDVPLGWQNVSESLVSLCAFSGLQMRVSKIGVLEFMRLSSALAPIVGMDRALNASIEDSDKNTRNVAKVFGIANNGDPVRSVQARPLSILPNDRIVVWQDPHISTTAYAQTIGTAALDQYAHKTQLGRASIVGTPEAEVGEFAIITVNDSTLAGFITELSSSLDANGYTQDIQIGSPCASMPIFPQPSSGSVVWLCATRTQLGRSYNCALAECALHKAIPHSRLTVVGK